MNKTREFWNTVLSITLASFLTVGLLWSTWDISKKKDKGCSGYTIIDSATIKDCNNKIIKQSKVYKP